MSTLEQAISLAALAHAGQVDKAGAPYILHPLRVMLRLEAMAERIAGVLHDVVEDCGWTIDRLRAEGFAEEILAAIDSVSRRPEESYEDLIARAAQDPIGRRVKLSDLADNSDLARLPEITAKDRARLEKYERAIAMLAETAHSPAQ